MNLKLEKIKKKRNLIDYSAFSEYIKNKNGKIIFTQGFRNTVKITSNKKLNHNEEFERKVQYLSIIKNFNETFHIKPKQKNNSIDYKSKSSKLFFPNTLKNKNILFKNKTMINFYKNKKINKNPFRIRSCINYENSDIHTSSNIKNIEKNNYYNDINYKEIYEQFEKIKNIINNDDNSSINNDNKKLRNNLIKNKSVIISNIDNINYNNNNYPKKYEKIRFIKKIKNINQKKNLIKLEKNKEMKSLYKKISFNTDKNNNNKNYISLRTNKKNNNLSSINIINPENYILKMKMNKTHKNKFRTLEDDAKVNVDIFREYDFNPSKAFLELKDNYKFIEHNNFESNSQVIRTRYIMKLRNAFNKNTGIKFQRNTKPSEKRIQNFIRHNIL